jgi:hypothetical protein
VNKKALIYAVAYSIFVIAFKLFILLGGYYSTKYGFYFAHITSVFLIIPFYIIGVKKIRDNDYNGIIAGKEAMRIALTIFAVSAVILSIYNYIEFEWKGKFLAINYYKSEQFMAFLKSNSKIKAEDYQKIITEQIHLSETSSFKATTGKLFSFMLIGLSSAFICSVFLKRSSKR